MKQFKKQIFKSVPAADPRVSPATLQSQKLLLLAEKAHCLLKKSAVVLIQEVSVDISGNTETINSLLNVNERLDELHNCYFGAQISYTGCSTLKSEGVGVSFAASAPGYRLK